MKIFRFFIFIITIYSTETMGCECELHWANWNEKYVYENIESDLVFIGNLVETSSEEHYYFEVVEVFKGDVNVCDTIEGSSYDSCSGWPHPKRKGLWIFYGNYYQYEYDEKIISGIDYITCGLTRSLFFPINDPKIHITNWDKELEILNAVFNKTVEYKLEHKP